VVSGRSSMPDPALATPQDHNHDLVTIVSPHVTKNPRSTPPPHHGKANKSGAEQRERRRLRDGFGDYDFAVAGLEIGNEDLVRSCIKGSAAEAREYPVISTGLSTQATAVAAPTTRGIEAAPTTTTKTSGASPAEEPGESLSA